MELNVIERIVLGDMIAQQSAGFTVLRSLRELAQLLSLTDDEVERVGVTVSETGRVDWGPKAAEVVKDNGLVYALDKDRLMSSTNAMRSGSRKIA